jgi:hypothetical protein
MSRKYRPDQLRIGGIPYGRPLQPKEKQIAKDCRDVLARHGYFVVRIQCGVWRTLHGNGFYSGAPKGTPDYAALHPAHPGFLLETKSGGGQLSEAQKVQHEMIRQSYRLDICTVTDALALENWLKDFESKGGKGRSPLESATTAPKLDAKRTHNSSVHEDL